MIIDAKLLCFIHVYDLSWNGLDMCSKLWSKCLPFRASLSAILSAFSWHFCLVGLSVYSYPELEAHVCDGLSVWKNTYHASITYYCWFVGFGFWTWLLVFVFVVVLVIGSLYWSIGSVFGPYFLLLLYRIGSRSFIPFFLTELSYSIHFFLPFCFYFSPRVIPIYFFSRSLWPLSF